MKFKIIENGRETKAACANTPRTGIAERDRPVVRRNGFILTGSYGTHGCLTVVDFDVYPGQKMNYPELLQQLQHLLQHQTLVVETGGGGAHVYLLVDAPVSNASLRYTHQITEAGRRIGFKGVDVRGEGGIVFAAGSKFTDHAQGYNIIQNEPVAAVSLADYNTLLQQFITPTVGSRPRKGFMDILSGDFQIGHVTQAESGLPEFLYWAAFYREMLNCAYDLENLLYHLEYTQPEFERDTTLQQLQYLSHPDFRPSREFYAELFPDYRDGRAAGERRAPSPPGGNDPALEARVTSLEQKIELLYAHLTQKEGRRHNAKRR